MSDATLLVTGASGKLGQQVVKHLLQTFKINPKRLIVTTRDPQQLQSLAAQGVTVRAADFDDAASLQQAFAGADHLLLISTNSAQRTQQQANAVAASQAAGIQHITYTSMPNPQTSPVVFAHEHLATEQAIQSSGIPSWAILRNNWYFENISDFQAAIFQSGVWLNATANSKVAQIARSDLGLAAAKAVLLGTQAQKIWHLNGAESLTVSQMAQILNSVLHLNIQVVTVDNASYQAKLREFHAPEPVVAILSSIEEHNARGLSEGSSVDFVQLTGQAPQSFQQWVEQHKAQLQALAAH
jgi:NAD(P)H dehydrogenase (quinone)